MGRSNFAGREYGGCTNKRPAAPWNRLGRRRIAAGGFRQCGHQDIPVGGLSVFPAALAIRFSGRGCAAVRGPARPILATQSRLTAETLGVAAAISRLGSGRRARPHARWRTIRGVTKGN